MMEDRKTEIIIAIIGLFGVIAGGLFANWNKVFPPENNSITKENIPFTEKNPQTESFSKWWDRKTKGDRP